MDDHGPFDGASTPIQLLSVDSEASSSDIPVLAEGVQGANEKFPQVLVHPAYGLKNASTFVECVEETPLELHNQVSSGGNGCLCRELGENQLNPQATSPMRPSTRLDLPELQENPICPLSPREIHVATALPGVIPEIPHVQGEASQNPSPFFSWANPVLQG